MQRVFVVLGVASPEVVVMEPTKKAENSLEKTVEPFGLEDRVRRPASWNLPEFPIS